MAKKRVARKTSDGGEASQSDTVDEPVAAAAAAVEQAKAALQHAQTAYQRTCATAAQQAAKTRGVTVGDMLDGTLEFVRRHPAAGLLAAGLIGFLFGRSKHR